MPGSRLKKHRREQIRASILIVLQVSYPVSTSERVVHATLGDVDDHLGVGELRSELAYLEEKDLIEIERINAKLWKAKLAALGVDVVQKAEERPPGIGPIDLEAYS